MKNLFSICIFILAVVTTSCSKESYMTEDVFTVGERAEVRVAILYEEKSFDISVTVTNTSQNTMVLVDAESLRPNRYVTFVNSFDEEGVYTYTRNNEKYTLEHILWDFTFDPDSLIFLESGESENYTNTYEYYLDEFLEKVILAGKAEVYFNKDDQIYFLVKYNPIPLDIKAIKALTNDYLVEPFEKKYLLEFPGTYTDEKFLDQTLNTP